MAGSELTELRRTSPRLKAVGRFSGILTCVLLFFMGLNLLPVALQPAAAQPPQSNRDSLVKFAGVWEGKCRDGRNFVVLTLQMTGNDLGGTVSIGNMQGDDEGACILVTAPPVPEHAQKISATVGNQNRLSFKGSKRPDGSFAQFELTETGPDKAELKLLDTPVEKHPWLLVKSEKTE